MHCNAVVYVQPSKTFDEIFFTFDEMFFTLCCEIFFTFDEIFFTLCCEIFFTFDELLKGSKTQKIAYFCKLNSTNLFLFLWL
jgi:hypothetical protein